MPHIDNPPFLDLGRFQLYPKRRQLISAAGGVAIELRPQAFDLLCLLAERRGEVVSKETLLETVWPGVVVTEDSLVQAVGDVRRALDDDSRTLIQTVPRRGYRLVLPPTGAQAITASAVQPAISDTATLAAIHENGPRKSVRFPMWLGFVAVFALLLGAVVWKTRVETRPIASKSNAPDRPPIAVLSIFLPDATISEQDLSHAFAHEIAGQLARNVDLQVISPISSAAASKAGTWREVAAKIGATYLVDVHLVKAGEVLRVQAQLLDARDGRIAWALSETLKTGSDVEAQRDEIVNRIAATMQTSMRQKEKARAAAQPANSLDVVELTLRGIALKHRLNPKDMAEAINLLERAHQLDPDYAPALAYLGYAKATSAASEFVAQTPNERKASIEGAINMLERAVAIDSASIPAYQALAVFLPAIGRLAESENAARHCVRLAPSDSDCLTFLANSLALRGKNSEAVGYIKTIASITPNPPAYVLAMVGRIQRMSGSTEAALSSFSQCLLQAPQFTLCRTERMDVYTELKQFAEANADAKILAQKIPAPRN
jgi:DNA-binding winged helix-turn-helix (wHTH) protein/TolB-like protein